MNRRYIFTYLILLLPLFAVGQQNILQKINAIKLADDYLWAEATYPTADSALAVATRNLIICVEGEFKRDCKIEEIRPRMKHINQKRATLTKVFAYIRKSDVKAIFGTTNQPSADTVAVFNPHPMALNLMKQKDVRAAYEYLKEQKAQGLITDFGAPRDPAAMSVCHLVIFDAETQHPICVLSPAEKKGQRTNLCNGAPDNYDRYEDSGGFVIWFNLNENQNP